MTNKQRNLLTSILFLVLGAFFLVQSLAVPHKIESDVGSGYVPAFICIVIMVVAAAKLIITLVRHDPYADEKEKSLGSMKGGIVTILIILAYVLLFEPLGFIVSSILFLFALINWFACSKNRNIILFAIISIALPIAVSALFYYVIKMPLPKGLIGF
jgi:putative tricarboxylic transport membrane protein